MEDSETERLLRENLALSKQNNYLLRKIRRGALWQTVFSLVYWALLIGIPVYLYYTYLVPSLQGISATYQSLGEKAGSLGQVPQQFKDLLQKFAPPSKTE